MANVLISGGSGLIGSHLSALLMKQGYSVGHLTRSVHASNGEIKYFNWAPELNTIDPKAIPWADHIIHLAGETVGQRWTASVKKKILASRVETSKLLINELEKKNHQIQSFISASALGYYGDDAADNVLSETSPKGEGFLSDVVAEWEQEVDAADKFSDRIVKIRMGMVLSESGGAMEKMTTPIKLGIGSALGSGKQWMSWIHIDDLCRMFLKVIQEPLTGVYNGVTPNSIRNSEFTQLLAKQLKRPLIMPKVPAFVLKLFLGEMSVLALGSIKTMPDAFVKEGFTFEYDTLDKALNSLI